jgi:RNA ligase (TIGR02306 family)
MKETDEVERTVKNDSRFLIYSDIQNVTDWPDVFELGEVIDVTEKLTGVHCRVGLIGGEWMAGSHKLQRTTPETEEDWQNNRYWKPLLLPGVKEMLMAIKGNQIILYGEIYGKGIQNLTYGQTGEAFAAFDIMVDGRYMDYRDFRNMCDLFGVPHVPDMGGAEYSLETIKRMAEGKAFMGDHIREGVVVKPLRERTHPKIGRVVLKMVSDAYLIKQVDSDTTDI